MDGFLFEMYSADANSPGGKRQRLVYVVASSAADALAYVGQMGLKCELVDSGPDVLDDARALGVADRDLKIVDAPKT